MLKTNKPEIKPGATYSNGDFGKHWAVRQILQIEGVTESVEQDQVTFKVLVGPGRRSNGSCTRVEFLQWVRYEEVRNENSWERIEVGN